MIDSPSREGSRLNLSDRLAGQLSKLTTFRQRLRLLKWLIPAGLVLLVVGYELGPSRWTYENLGFNYHLTAEIALFGTVGPLLAFVLLELLDRWIEERETADLQSQLLTEAGEKHLQSRTLCDDTLQVLFATNLLIGSIKAEGAKLPPNTEAQIETTEQALNESIKNLRSYLLK